MNWESVQELKTELKTPAPGRGIAAQELQEPAAAGRPQALRRRQPSIALGAAPTERRDDYQLAIRVQRQELMQSARLSAIVERARGEVDVQYVGPGFKQSGPRAVRPLTSGCSIGHHAISAGTLGAFVAGPSGTCMLSNNHVLADEDRAEIGDQILQPGPADGGERTEDAVGFLTSAIPLTRHQPNRFDAALAELAEGIEADPSDLEALGTLRGLGTPGDVLGVAKLGRTTGITHGRITALDLDEVFLTYETGEMRFDGVIEIEGTDSVFTASGDSGSLVVTDEDAPEAIGLHFGGLEGGRSVVCPLPELLEQLSVQLIT